MAKKSSATSKGYRKTVKKKPFLTKKEIIALIVIVAVIVLAVVLFNLLYNPFISAKDVKDNDIITFASANTKNRYVRLGSVTDLDGYTRESNITTENPVGRNTYTPVDENDPMEYFSVSATVVTPASMMDYMASYYAPYADNAGALIETEVNGHTAYICSYTMSEYVEEEAADEPAADATAGEPADEPAADEPAADEPAAGEPVADEPAADATADEATEPTADEPAADAATDEPAADEPAADEPAADEAAEPAADEAAEPAADEVAEPAADEATEPAADEAADEAAAEEEHEPNTFYQNISLYIAADDSHSIGVNAYFQGSDDSFYMTDEEIEALMLDLTQVIVFPEK